MSNTSENIAKTAFSVIDMMLQMQRIGLRAMTMYEPLTSAYLEKASQQVGVSAVRSRPAKTLNTNEEQVIGIGEEVLNVGTRMVQGKTTKVRRVVVEAPVQQDVTLHSETVVLERRRPISSNGNGVLTEVTVEMSDFNEVPVVSKGVRLVEEVLLRKETTARIETIHDTVKRDKLEIDQPTQLPVVFDAMKNQEEGRRADDDQDTEQSVTPVAPEHNSDDHPGD